MPVRKPLDPKRTPEEQARFDQWLEAQNEQWQFKKDLALALIPIATFMGWLFGSFRLDGSLLSVFILVANVYPMLRWTKIFFEDRGNDKDPLNIREKLQ